jgi:hypothetical protein
MVSRIQVHHGVFLFLVFAFSGSSAVVTNRTLTFLFLSELIEALAACFFASFCFTKCISVNPEKVLDFSPIASSIALNRGYTL